MEFIYVLKEYSQGFLDDSKFSNRKDIEFSNHDDYIDLIDAVFECVADSNLTIEELQCTM